MKTINILILTILLLLSCERNWDNLLSTDDDLKNTPNIIQINLDSEKNITIILNYAYSDLSSIVLERRSVGGFETINYIRESQTTLTDTSFDKESSHNFVYRVSVTKDEHRSSYSDEKSFIYTSTGLYNPESLVAVSVEMQGIRLEWNDKSNYEDSYIIEKDEGSGYTEIATLSSNTESYFDAISGTPSSPLQLDYRVKAFSTDLESDWVSMATEYSGLGSPTNLQVKYRSPMTFVIEWLDHSVIESGYSVERKIDAGNFSEVINLGQNQTKYIDNVTDAGVFTYRVRAKKDNYYSSYSNVVIKNSISIPPTAGLVAFYPFNENADDESGNGNNGTVYGATLTTDRFGNSNSAYSFDGVNDYIEIPHSELINFAANEDFSITIFIKPPITQINTESNNNEILSKWGANNGYPYTIRYFNQTTSNNGRIQCGRYDGISAVGFGSTTEINNDYFHHIVFIKNDVMLFLYIDGVLESSIEDAITGNTTNSNEVLIGRRAFGHPSHEFKGVIDNVRIFDRALTDEEILALYQEGGWGK